MAWRQILRGLREGGAEAPAPDEAVVRELARALEEASRVRLGRAMALLHVDAGDGGGCALELRAVRGVMHDLRRHGMSFATTPRQADVLLVSGPLARNARESVILSWEAMAEPKWLVGIGDCAVDGGVFKGSYAVDGGIGAVLKPDLLIPGCPPDPAQILHGLRTLLAATAMPAPRR
jgi:Ni,Fe-hydrogenase III small subunit